MFHWCILLSTQNVISNQFEDNFYIFSESIFISKNEKSKIIWKH